MVIIYAIGILCNRDFESGISSLFENLKRFGYFNVKTISEKVMRYII